VLSGECPSTDQRGVARPQDGQTGRGSVCDVSAYEFQPHVNLGLTVTGAPDPAQTIQPVTYTIHATNAGPDTGFQTDVHDTYPSSATLRNVSPSQGSGAGDGIVPFRLVCPLGPIASGADATIAITLLPVRYGPLISDLNVSGPYLDPVLANNFVEVTTTVNPV